MRLSLATLVCFIALIQISLSLSVGEETFFQEFFNSLENPHINITKAIEDPCSQDLIVDCKSGSVEGLSITANITGIIPASIRELRSLETLEVSGASISNDFLELLCPLNNISKLFIDSSGRTSIIPECIGNMTSLSKLIIHGELHGEIPQSIGNLRELTTLDLSFNDLTGDLPDSMENLTSLIVLNLRGNIDLDGELPEEFYEQLSTLNITDTGISFDADKIDNTSQITTLAFDTDESSIDEEIFDLASLQELHISGSSLTGAIPIGFQRLQNLHTLEISYTQMGGVIPGWLFEMPKLSTLILNDNKFIAIGQFDPTQERKLVLDLSSNNILSRVLDFSDFAHIDISDNRFFGWLPANMLSWHATYIDVSRNSLIGLVRSLPDAIEQLDISDNKFWGEMSQMLGRVKHLDIANNSFWCPEVRVLSKTHETCNYSGNWLCDCAASHTQCKTYDCNNGSVPIDGTVHVEEEHYAIGDYLVTGNWTMKPTSNLTVEAGTTIQVVSCETANLDGNITITGNVTKDVVLQLDTGCDVQISEALTITEASTGCALEVAAKSSRHISVFGLSEGNCGSDTSEEEPNYMIIIICVAIGVVVIIVIIIIIVVVKVKAVSNFVYPFKRRKRRTGTLNVVSTNTGSKVRVETL